MAEYQAEMTSIDPDDVVYIDETGLAQFLSRPFAWSPRGVEVRGRICGRKFARLGIVAGQMAGRIVAPLEYSGCMDSALFEQWFAEVLLPEVPVGKVIVMDNAAFHRKARLRELAEAACRRLVFLPPYSPDFNPIEHFWSWLKRAVADCLRTVSSLQGAITAAFRKWATRHE